MQLLVATGIRWERVNLYVTFQLVGDNFGDPFPGDSRLAKTGSICHSADPNIRQAEVVRIVCKCSGREQEVEWKIIGASTYEIALRISDFAYRSFIPSGVWSFCAYIAGPDETELALKSGCSPHLLNELVNRSKVFPYNHRKDALTINFAISDKWPMIELEMVVLYLTLERSSRLPKAHETPRNFREVKAWLDRNGWRQRIKRRLASNLYRMLSAFFRAERSACNIILRTRSKQRILLASSTKSSLTGNLLAVKDGLLGHEACASIIVRTSLRDPRTSGLVALARQLRSVARSDVVVLDDYFSLLDWISVRHEQTVVQLWHAGIGFKNVGYSRFGLSGSPSLTSAHRHYTFAIVAAPSMIPVYSEAFGIEASAILPLGLPRTDQLIDPRRVGQSQQWLRDNFPQFYDKKIILFAPTYRGNDVNDASYPFDMIDFERLYEICGDQSVVVFFMHPFVNHDVPIPLRLRDRIIDLSRSVDIACLLHLSSLLITDYSSLVYDYAILNKPTVLYAFDRYEYEAVRGFHHDYSEMVPGKICNTFDELIRAIETEDYELWKLVEFQQRFLPNIDGRATERVIDLLLSLKLESVVSRR